MVDVVDVVDVHQVTIEWWIIVMVNPLFCDGGCTSLVFNPLVFLVLRYSPLHS